MEKSITTIYIIRHGQSQGNAFGEQMYLNSKHNKELGTELTDLGRKQAQECAIKLKDVHFDAIFASDLHRASQTAEIISLNRKLPVTTDKNIREREWGNFGKGMTKENRLEIEKGMDKLNDEEKLLYRYYPDGETAMEAVNRFLAFLIKIIPLYKNKTILVVNHGNIMRSLLIYLKWATYKELPPGSIINTGYYVLETNGSTFKVIETNGIKKVIS